MKGTRANNCRPQRLSRAQTGTIPTKGTQSFTNKHPVTKVTLPILLRLLLNRSELDKKMKKADDDVSMALAIEEAKTLGTSDDTLT
jgi:hypothetical protein